MVVCKVLDRQDDKASKQVKEQSMDREQIIRMTREACSDIAEEYSSDGDPDAGTIIAQRIRARGNT